MKKSIMKPILLGLVAVAGVASTAVVASAASALSTTTAIAQTAPAATPVVGQSVTYTATVTINPVGGGTDPTGTVTFSDLANSIPGCTSATLAPVGNPANGGAATATCTTTYTKAESGSITAAYGGDSNYATSNGSFAQTIAQGSSTTTIAASTSTPVTGQSVVFTATVKAGTGTAATPLGTVSFTNPSPVTSDAPVPAACAAAPLSGSGGTATATCTIVFGLTATSTTETLHAAYGGDSNFTSSADSTDAVVTGTTAAATRVLISSSVNPSISGQPVVFTATVVATAPGSGTPTGTLTFGTSPVCTNLVSQQATLAAGSATCSVAAGTLLAANSPISVTAAYSGTATVPLYSSTTAASSAFSQTVDQNTTATTLIASPAKPAAGGELTLTAVIIGPPPGSGPLTGNVTFQLTGKHSGPLTCDSVTVFGGSTVTGTNNIALPNTSPGANEVTCTLLAVPASSNPLKVTVSYSGDHNFVGSASKTAKIKLS
jgi:hypothetical protein